MSPPLELDYIGLSQPAATAAAAAAGSADDLKGTELRLGLPGSESPDRRVPVAATTLDLLPSKGAKRGFSDDVPLLSPAAAAGKGKKVADEEEEDRKVAATPQPAAK
jgi:auxin-responsive protein IAA